MDGSTQHGCNKTKIILLMSKDPEGCWPNIVFKMKLTFTWTKETTFLFQMIAATENSPILSMWAVTFSMSNLSSISTWCRTSTPCAPIRPGSIYRTIRNAAKLSLFVGATTSTTTQRWCWWITMSIAVLHWISGSIVGVNARQWTRWPGAPIAPFSVDL